MNISLAGKATFVVKPIRGLADPREGISEAASIYSFAYLNYSSMHLNSLWRLHGIRIAKRLIGNELPFCLTRNPDKKLTSNEAQILAVDRGRSLQAGEIVRKSNDWCSCDCAKNLLLSCGEPAMIDQQLIVQAVSVTELVANY